MDTTSQKVKPANITSIIALCLALVGSTATTIVWLNDSLAEAVIIVGILCSSFFGILSLVLSVAGLNQIKKGGQRGKALAVIAIVLSSILLASPFLIFFAATVAFRLSL